MKSGKISGVIIRPAMIYGPGDLRTLKLFSMISKRRFFYVGTGDVLVHFIDVRDLARAFISALNYEKSSGEFFIIAGSEAMPLRSLVSIIASELGVKEPWVHVPVRPMQMFGTLCEGICTPLGISPPIFRRRVDFLLRTDRLMPQTLR